ncbi:MAG TPA: regulatory protein RecX [Microbacterium sp.]|uniref:regulatory protein RecX n=1 Tax=Microbacterium sp. TaxID=51671 RepID=UPI002B475BF1|nr:regulatory protein RecX [Microbacterium sp.]HKT57142.1 regulatory protein RecX [Microbacterium sp.]
MNEWSGGEDSERDDIAPVIPLFAERMPRPSAAASAQAIAPNHPAFADVDQTGRPPQRRSTVRFVELDQEPVPAESMPTEAVSAEPDPQGHLEFAEKALLRKLRTRSLSIREARGVLVGFDLAGDDIDDMVGRFEASGYLDDAALAEQLVHAGSTRKGQGRQAIAQTMSGRGIPRDIADAALADLPDDDLERALDYARSKAAAMARLDPQAALRRLVGQLTRRGYPSHIAMTAARQALDEQTRPRGPYFA